MVSSPPMLLLMKALNKLGRAPRVNTASQLFGDSFRLASLNAASGDTNEPHSRMTVVHYGQRLYYTTYYCLTRECWLFTIL